MTSAYDDEEMPLPLLRRSVAKEPSEAEDDIPAGLPRDYRDAKVGDRFRPASAGALAGLVAGAGGLGVVHALHLTPISNGIVSLAARLGLAPDAALPVAYLAAALGGAIVGAGVASVTKNLRRSFAALIVWAEVFFVSLTMLLLALSSAYGRGLGVSMAPAILLASAAYALVVSFQLPLRRRA